MNGASTHVQPGRAAAGGSEKGFGREMLHPPPPILAPAGCTEHADAPGCTALARALRNGKTQRGAGGEKAHDAEIQGTKWAHLCLLAASGSVKGKKEQFD